MASPRDVQDRLNLPDLRALLPQAAPGMRAQEVASDPLVAYNFRVTVGGVAMGFAEVSGLQRTYEHVTYRHGLSFSEGEKIDKVHLDRYAPITMKRGTVYASTTLRTWLEDRAPRAIDIVLCGVGGAALVRWRVAKGLAVKLVAPTFDAGGNEVAIETLEVMAAGISVADIPE